MVSKNEETEFILNKINRSRFHWVKLMNEIVEIYRICRAKNKWFNSFEKMILEDDFHFTSAEKEKKTVKYLTDNFTSVEFLFSFLPCSLSLYLEILAWWRQVITSKKYIKLFYIFNKKK